MISFVRGTVAAVGPDQAVIDVGGVGLALQCAPATLADLRVGHEAVLQASLVVREDSLTLFGFADSDERTVFELLQSVTGVGPRLAQALLAVHRPDALRRAVATDDVGALMLVPGVGRKGAQRLVLELKDRLGSPAIDLTSGSASPSSAGSAWQSQVHAALLGLGWAPREADAAVTAVTPEADLALADGREPDVSVLLRSALRTLDRS